MSIYVPFRTVCKTTIAILKLVIGTDRFNMRGITVPAYLIIAKLIVLYK